MSDYLQGLRVLDLSRLLPGPYASLMLAEMGADVVKVEDTAGGDYARSVPPLVNGTSVLYLALNRGKKIISVDLKKSEGKEIILELVKTYDVVLESFRPGVLDRLELNYETLKKANPNVILCSISGYGQSGPYRDRAGHDLNYQALSGIVEMTGNRGGPPGIPGAQVADLAGGSMTAALSIIASVFKRNRTGEGEHIDVAMCDSLISLQPITILELSGNNTRPVRGDTTLQGLYICYNIYETKDGRHMTLAALEPKFFMNFCMQINRPDLMSHHYDTADESSEAYLELCRIFLTKTQEEWIELFKEIDVCVEPVLNPSEIENHPHFKTRDLFFSTELQGDIKLTSVKTVPALNKGNPPDLPSPAFGPDTEKILKKAGFDDAKLQELKAANVIRLGE